MACPKNKFYSVVTRKYVTIPDKDITTKTKNNRKFLVGKYKVNGKEYEAWKVTGMAKKKKK